MVKGYGSYFVTELSSQREPSQAPKVRVQLCCIWLFKETEQNNKSKG